MYGVLLYDASSSALKLPFTTFYPATSKSLITRTLPFNQPLKDPPIWPSPRTMSRTQRKHRPRTRSDERSSVEIRSPNVAIRTLFFINILEPSTFRSWRCFCGQVRQMGIRATRKQTRVYRSTILFVRKIILWKFPYFFAYLDRSGTITCWS